MTDIVERLRADPVRDVGAIYDTDVLRALISEAADEIERLREYIKKYCPPVIEKLEP